MQSLRALADESGIPRRLEQFPAEAIPEVIREAFRECHGTYPVPRYYSRSRAEALLQGVCRGGQED